MKPTASLVEEKEEAFYMQFLDMALEYAKGGKDADGIQFRQVVAAAGVVAKQRQTRGAMRALSYQIARDTHGGKLPAELYRDAYDIAAEIQQKAITKLDSAKDAIRGDVL